MNNMTHKDLKTLFNEWWDALDDNHFTSSPLEQAAKDAFEEYVLNQE